MHKNDREKSDYKKGEIYYYVFVTSSYNSIHFTKVKMLHWYKHKYDNDLVVRNLQNYIGHEAIEFNAHYSWFAKTYDEALDEIINSRLSKKEIIEIIFK